MIVYVDATAGNDAHSGATPEQAWRTLARVSRQQLQPGDQVLLRRGSVWEEGLRLRGRATLSQPIVLGGYGDGPRPRINGGQTHAISADEPISGWRIEGLELTSANDLNPTRRILGGTCGIHFTQSELCQGLVIQDCLIHDTSGPGVYLLATGDPKAVFRQVTIERCEVSRASCGIQFWAHPTFGTDYFPGFHIAHCLVHDIGGDGIVPFCGRDGVVEYCTAFRTGLGVAPDNHSPVAIWFAWARNCIIQYCEAYDNRTGGRGADGGGFDLDGGCADCVLQYNYSHDNEGAGYLICSWDPTQWPCTGAVCRFNVSINDGLANDYASIFFWQADGSRVYNNTCLTRHASPLKFHSDTRGHLIANNIFLVDSQDDLPLAKSAFDIATNTFSHNLWWRASGGLRFDLPGGRITSLEELARLVGAEGELAADPRLADPAHGDVHLQDDSPCIGAGLRLPDMGPRDYYGAPIPATGPVDIGCAAADRAS